MSINIKLRQWSYHRQRLGKSGSSLTNLTQVLKDIIGVYSSHPTAPLSLYARVKSFTEQAFYKLDDNTLALRVPAMRLSVYMLPKETARRIMSAVVPPASDLYWEKRYATKGRAIPKEPYAMWKKKILQLTRKPLPASEIKQRTGIADGTIKPVLNRMAFEGDLLRVGAKNLRSNIISYVSADTWAGKSASGGFTEVDSDKALAWLAGEYLRAFGPARLKDFQWWAGVTAGRAKSAIAAHETVIIENNYLLLKSDIKDFDKFKIPTKDTLDLLPQWDSYTMGYAPDGRARFVDPEMQHHIYGALGATGGNALGTVLVNCEAHGAWDFSFKGNKMNAKLNMFTRPTGNLREDIESELSEIAGLFKAKELIIEQR